MLELRGINSFYGDAHILFDVSLGLKEQEIAVLFGRNGVGKTTTFRSIMGLTPPRCAGDILFKGENILGLPPFRIARMGMGYVPEDRQIFPNLSVRRNLMVGRKKRKDQAKKWDLDEVYHIFPKLRDLEGKPGSYLSGGEQQMLTIARTLMGDPDILLLDEPTEGLAPLMAKHLLQTVVEIKEARQMSLLVVEQFSPEILDYVDSCYVMERGRIVYRGNPDRIRKDEELQKTLLGVAASTPSPARS
jgi:branched-chain amino acid transport system ATP-binding protein